MSSSENWYYTTDEDNKTYAEIIHNSVFSELTSLPLIVSGNIIIYIHRKFGFRVGYCTVDGQLTDSDASDRVYSDEIARLWVIGFDSDIGI